ncbi:hypothetical protein OG921_03115 [Aldersonia sp. NBC_00410]|uniref:hypothetical protein n=1 Tax=Aldersonia sp. NBC_00410 TaxID=2975954 RepID=UPI00225AC9A0|nr:hypothetical protein [Aldersonia sp. NBC_00410]MCX5042181.1 hypothetical protein [Aldersonia sp. NBC_00410]
MSPVSRGRKPKKKPKQQRKSAGQERVIIGAGADEPCDCPECTGEPDLDAVIDQFIGVNAELPTASDPLDGEVGGAFILALVGSVGPDFEYAMVDGILPAIEERATPEALATLLAVGSVADGLVGTAADSAADRLAASGIPRPPWADEALLPVGSAEHQVLADADETMSVLSCTFNRAGRAHAMVVIVDEFDCGAASEIALLEADELAGVLDDFRTEMRAEDIELVAEAIAPEEFRWQVDNALSIRADHDFEDAESGEEPELEEEEITTYESMAALLRRRLRDLPRSDKPPRPHGDGIEFTPEGPQQM